MSLYELRTIDGQSVLARVIASASVLEAAKTASMQAALNMLTAYTDLPYGFYDTFFYDSVIPVMTGATTAGTVITAKSNLTGRDPWRAGNGVIDGDGWVSSAAPTASVTQWLKISMPRLVTITRYNLILFAYSPNTWKLYISAAENPATYDPASSWASDPDWVEVHDITGNTENTTGAKLGDYIFAQPHTCKHIAFVPTAANGGAARVGFSEINLYGGGVNTNTVTNATINSGFITPTGAATIISTADTASAAPTHAMGMIWMDADGATVTDATEANNAIRLSISRDNGSTWDWLPLTDGGAVSGDVRLYSCAEKLLTATSGTNVKLKLTSHDLGSGAPDFELHGWGCVYNEGA